MMLALLLAFSPGFSSCPPILQLLFFFFLFFDTPDTALSTLHGRDKMDQPIPFYITTLLPPRQEFRIPLELCFTARKAQRGQNCFAFLVFSENFGILSDIPMFFVTPPPPDTRHVLVTYTIPLTHNDTLYVLSTDE
jgi:hypothetical protein